MKILSLNQSKSQQSSVETIQISKLIEQNFWRDNNQHHRRIIELYDCKICQKKLMYLGLSNAQNYFAIGTCQNCNQSIYFVHLSDLNIEISANSYVPLRRAA